MGRDGRPDDIRLSFSRAVDAYDRVRPTYPAPLLDALFARLPPAPEVVEVGPGTGQATRDLLARGASVHAVEIGPEMADRLRANLPSERLRVTVGDFERVELAARSADAVVSFTAYHWISPAAQTDRPATILRPGGTLAVIDVVQVDAPEDDGFFAAAQPIYARHGQAHTGPPAPRREDVDPPIRRTIEADPRFAGVAVRRWDADQTYTAETYRLLMESYSATQMMEEADRAGLLDAIEALVRTEHGGRVTRPLVVALTTATLV